MSEKARTVSVEDAGQQLGIGRQLAYELARGGKLPGVIKLGHRYVVSQAAIDRVLAGDPSYGAGAKTPAGV
ncbi:MAG: helix-turn-helix domain-containing protein [Chloroflexi bacterium]|nr:helix-turn-helix domain-containing protein [Chloroflexota bacterium]